MTRYNKSMAVLGLTVSAAACYSGEFPALEVALHGQAVSRATVTAQQAVDAVLQQAKGATLVEVELEMRGETPIYEVEVLSDAGETEFKVDATNGKIMSSEAEALKADEMAEHQALQKALQNAGFSLQRAIVAALADTKDATVVEAEADTRNNQAEFSVDLLVPAREKQPARLVVVQYDATGKPSTIRDQQAVGQTWTFETSEIDKAPTSWRFGHTNSAGGKAVWTVQSSGAAGGGRVLALAARSELTTYNVALVPETRYADVDVTARIRADTGKNDQGGGLLWRCRDENNYYICRINPLESNFRVYKVVAGKREQLATTDLNTKAGQWYTVRATMRGDKIECFVDGKRLLESTDGTLREAGMIGLWTKADASTAFDNVAVQAPPDSKAH